MTDPLHANPVREVPDVVACLKGVGTLDWRYRPKMQTQCFEAAGEICLADDNNEGQCMQSLVLSIREYYDRLLPMLPADIDENGVQKWRYASSLANIRDTFLCVSQCSEIIGYNKTTCEFITLGVALSELMYLAGEAKIDLP
ncbi:MAG: hypothetical protein AAGA28_16330 [Pseudomonadota bacterium]